MLKLMMGVAAALMGLATGDGAVRTDATGTAVVARGPQGCERCGSCICRCRVK
ncbi:MAG TPA: hypothetical protein VJB14_10570 [Planctomycetota bacterium]|nr:hypothetical protein [Planctomycetota bacterium]